MYAYAFNNPINYEDSSGHWPKWLKASAKVTAKIATVVAVAVVAVVVTVAVVSAAPVVATSVAVTSASLGASGATIAAAATLSKVATIAVGVAVAANGVSRVGEVVTGTNVIRDKIMKGNDDAYGAFETTLGVASAGLIIVGQTYSVPINNPRTNNDVGIKGQPFSNVTMDKGYIQTRFFDYKGRASLDIDHHSGPGHAVPHFHIWDYNQKIPRSDFINRW